MRTTYPEAYFNFIDVTALADSRVSSLAAKEFSDPGLYHENIRQAAYGTMELNQFLLDGSREIFPSGQPRDVPFWSDEKSDGSCLYVKNPTLEISFSEPHSSIGLNLYFAGDAPAEILVTWYTLYGTKLISETFHPEGEVYFCKCHVQDYGRIVIEFVRSSWPDRYVKMDHVEYGKMWRLGRDVIKTASIYEEVDVTSATLSINTALIEVLDVEEEFSLSNQEGLWKSLQKEQQVAVTEYIDGRPVDCGTFYLDTWDVRKSLVRFSMIDILGVMDKTKFYGGRVYENEKAGNIIDSIMASCEVREYAVEREVYDTEVSGWLAIQSHRAALQQVVFACGAVADCSRSDSVRIYSPDRHVSRTIGLGQKFTGAKITLDDYVSDVSVSYTYYRLDGEAGQISKSILPAGTSRIEFSSPYLADSITVSAGIVREASTNYVVVEMEQEGECRISGRKYEAVENTCTAGIQVTEAGEVRKSIEYRGCTLMDAEKARRVAERILEYCQMRQLMEMRYVNDGEAVGNWCDIALAGGGQATTGLVSQTLDLAGGNTAAAKCRGYSRNTTDYYFAGMELYADEGGII